MEMISSKAGGDGFNKSNEFNNGFKEVNNLPKFALNDSNDSKFSNLDKPLGNDVTVRKIDCRNEHLAGKNHDVTGVKFERKVVSDGMGGKVEGVFPKFESVFNAQLDRSNFMSSDSVQFDRANKQLLNAVNINPNLAKQFTPQQLDMIKAGDKPKGYTWHHSEKAGQLQLVKTNIHDRTGHTGGKNVWGGGSQNR